MCPTAYGTDAPRQTDDAVPGAPHVSVRRLLRKTLQETSPPRVGASPVEHSLRHCGANRKMDIKSLRPASAQLALRPLLGCRVMVAVQDVGAICRTQRLRRSALFGRGGLSDAEALGNIRAVARRRIAAQPKF